MISDNVDDLSKKLKELLGQTMEKTQQILESIENIKQYLAYVSKVTSLALEAMEINPDGFNEQICDELETEMVKIQKQLHGIKLIDSSIHLARIKGNWPYDVPNWTGSE